MFNKTAKYYDKIYSFKDYQDEALNITKCLRSANPDIKTILDVGCGTAEHHRHLKSIFKVDGIDLNQEFLDIARIKNPDGIYTLADMTEFDLGKKYDAVVCLFSSIGYILSIEKITQTLKTFKHHLKPGGIIVLEPWMTPDKWKSGFLHMLNYEEENLKISRMSYSSKKENLSHIHFHYLIGTPDGIQFLEEVHLMGLYTINEMKLAFTNAGLQVEHDPKGFMDRGRYLASIAEN